MRGLRLVGLIFVILGILALVYRGFAYTQESHDAKIGPIEIEVKEKKRVEIPTWVGVGLAGAGAALLLAGGRRR